MTAKHYAKTKIRDNHAYIDKYVGGKHVKFLAFISAIVDCDIQMETNRNNEKEYLFYHETKTHLVTAFETYCILNKSVYLETKAP